RPDLARPHFLVQEPYPEVEQQQEAECERRLDERERLERERPELQGHAGEGHPDREQPARPPDERSKKRRAEPVVRADVARLARECGRATFFLVGEQVQRRPGLAAEIGAAGHEVALHGHRHRVLLRVPPTAAREDLERGADAIASATGRGPAFYRQPYGIFSW